MDATRTTPWLASMSLVAAVGCAGFAGYLWWWEANATESLGIGMVIAPVVAVFGLVALGFGAAALSMRRRSPDAAFVLALIGLLVGAMPVLPGVLLRVVSFVLAPFGP